MPGVSIRFAEPGIRPGMTWAFEREAATGSVARRLVERPCDAFEAVGRRAYGHRLVVVGLTLLRVGSTPLAFLRRPPGVLDRLAAVVVRLVARVGFIDAAGWPLDMFFSPRSTLLIVTPSRLDE